MDDICYYFIWSTKERLHYAGLNANISQNWMIIIKIARLFILLKELFAKTLNQNLKKTLVPKLALIACNAMTWPGGVALYL